MYLFELEDEIHKFSLNIISLLFNSKKQKWHSDKQNINKISVIKLQVFLLLCLYRIDND